jgi:predicted Zn-dependent protease with MMP-like domain
MRRMSLKRFGAIVAQVMETLPPVIRAHLENIVVDVEDEPSEELLRELDFTDDELDDGASLYGLFVPFQLGAPDNIDFLDRPNRVLIFKRPLEEDFPDQRQLRIEIRKTVIHELAHHFGWTDRDLERFDNTDDPFGDEPQ